MITATYDAAFRKKHGAMPMTPMMTPATAGPITRAMLMLTVLSVTALWRCSRPTISITNVWRAGLSSAVMHPNARAHRYTIQSSTTSVAVRVPSVSATSPKDTCVIRSTRRFGNRSAMSPPNGPEQQHGQELQCDDEAERGAAAGQLEDQPGLSHRLHPGARQRDRLADHVEPVVPTAVKGAERLRGSCGRSGLAYLLESLTTMRSNLSPVA